MTKAAFAALGSNPNTGIIRVSYIIPGAARHVPSSNDSVSISHSESKPTAATSLPARDDQHGISHDIPKPPVKFIESPNHSSRNNTKIDMIVMHYTDEATRLAVRVTPLRLSLSASTSASAT